MTFFKKTWVAVLLTVLIVALCCAWGYNRVADNTQVQGYYPGNNQNAGESNLNYYLNWVDDSADLFSMETIHTIARENLVLDNGYNSLLAIKTISYLEGRDLQSYAEETAETISLGENSMLLVLDANAKTWYVTYGPGLSSYIESSSTLPSMFRRHLNKAFWEDGQSDAVILALFGNLEAWYDGNVPSVQTSDNLLGPSGKVPSISFGAILSGILFTLLANLWWIVILFIALNIVDGIRFDRYIRQSRQENGQAAHFHPFLFWHRPGSAWFEDKVEDAAEEAEEEANEGFDDYDNYEEYDERKHFFTRGKSDRYERGPGYSTDPNEPGPFAPPTGTPNNGNPSSSDSMMQQLWQLWKSLLGLLWEVIDRLTDIIRQFTRRR